MTSRVHHQAIYMAALYLGVYQRQQFAVRVTIALSYCFYLQASVAFYLNVFHAFHLARNSFTEAPSLVLDPRV